MTKTGTFPTLDAALAEIAARSFYESATVTPNDDGTFDIEDDFGSTFPDEIVLWDYVNGAEWPEGATDNSRVHEPYETYISAEHVRYNLTEAVTDLEAGRPVTFAYLVIEEECDDEGAPNAHENNVCPNCDAHGRSVIGWALVSQTHNI